MPKILRKYRVFTFLILALFFSINGNAQCTITGTSVLASTYNPNPCTALTGCNGILYIGNGTTATNLVVNSTLNLSCLGPIQLIVKNGATIDFSSGNDYLTLAAGSSITFEGTGSLIGTSNCTASQRLYIGSDLIATCNGNGPGADVSFSVLVTAGGYNPVSVTPSPPSVCGSGSFSFTATASPSSGASFNWYNVPTGGTSLNNTATYTTPSPISTTTTYYVAATYASASPAYTTVRRAVTATVNPLPTLVLSSGIASQTVCSTSNIVNTVYTWGGGATNVNVTGLPAGLSSVINTVAKTVTISGTPTASGTYTITTTGQGAPCTAVSLSGSITVNAIVTAGAIGTSQTICSGATPSAFTSTSTGTGSGVLSYEWQTNASGSFVTIPGATAATYSPGSLISTTSYQRRTVSLSGGITCYSPYTSAVTITVTANNTVGAASSTPTLCVSTSLTSITHTTIGATGIGSPTGLPAGVNAAWASNTITISGTPTASGTFNYSIPLTGGCGAVNATGTITVTPLNTVAAGVNRTTCINSAITNITLATTGATGATVTGLPAGVTGSWAANVVTISGTPTASGTFNYTVTTTGGCIPATTTGTITVTPLNTVAAGVNRTTCINSAITNITLATTGATGATVTGLPAGVTGSWAANVVTISGTPTASGTFNYTVTTTGGCIPATTTGTITVTPLNTVAAGTSQTVCISSAITSITLATTGATGATVTGLPAGVTGSWAANVVTISGTPTASGTFNYTVTTTGGCIPATTTGTITVTPLNTVAAGTNQTVCISSATTNITLATTGATGATVTGLPAGVTGSWAANVVTISGTPTASGTFNYTVTTTGGCIPATTIGTITVTPLNTVAAGTSQTVCISSAITNITLATTGATGATVTGLPAGVTGSWAANVVTISGTPTASGTFNYTVTTTGGCIPATTTGTITVTPLNTVAAGTSQTVCISSAITSITLATTGATGATVTGLPAGVTGSWAANVVTISGTPTASGTFNYTVTTTGGCIPATTTGTITVTANNTVGAASSTPTLCVSTSLTSITHTTIGATGIGSPTGLPAGVSAAWASNTITISGTPTASGTFNYSIPLTGGCGAVNAIGTINVEALSIGGSVGGGTTICSGSTSALLTLTGYTGTIIKWQSSVSPFSTWTDIVNTGATYTSGVLTTTTQFRAVVQSGSCLPSNSSVTTVTINPLPNNITNGFAATTICTGGSPQLTFDADDTTFSAPYTITYKNNTAATLYTVSIPSAAPYSFTPGDNPTINAGYTLISISNATCTTTSGFLDAGASLIVRPMPTATISASASSACVGTSSPIVTIGNPQTVAVTVAYTINGVAQTVDIVASGSSIVSVPTTTSGTFIYSLVSANYQSTPNCTNAISGSATVTINPNLAASLTIAASPTGVICSNTSVTFTASPVNGGTTPSYQWKLNGSNVGINSATYTNASWTNGDVVTCVMSSNASPCLTGSPVTSNGITMAVNPNLPASVSIAPLPVGAICAGTSVTFTATPTNGGTSPTYQWYNGATLISGATGATYTSTSLANGDAINVVMTSNATCATASPATSNTVTMTVPSPAIWNGSWTNGPPTNAQALVFNGSYSSIGDMEACSCQVNSGAVTINSGHLLKITNGVTVSGGSLTFENAASLAQINNAAINSGNINYKRTSSIILDTDYVYWSSPVVGYTLGQVSPDTPAGRMYSYDAFATPEDWQLESAGTVMAAGKGYIIRGPDYPPPLPPFPSGFPATFVGVPNNGVITTPIGGVNTSNLIGNPYPSALDADAFLAANSAVLEGTIYFWTHNTAIQVATNITNGTAGSGAYAYTSDDYASYNGTGSVAASAAGFNGSITPSGKIGAGQSFFATSIAAGQVATFTNAMRLDTSGAKLDNSQFFKNASNSKAVEIREKNRIWLNLTNAQGAFKQTLVGYISGATNEIDHAFDGESFDGNEFIDFYSINNDKNLTIQGRALPFDELDEVPLGYRSAVDADYTISLDHVDGIFMDKAVYLKDNKNNKIVNLKESAYTFKTGTGTFNDRFVLLFYNTAPQVVNPNKFGNEILISNKDKQIKINSSDETIETVVIYDLLGRQIYKKSNISAKELLVLNLPVTKQAVLVKIKLKEGKTINKTIIY